MLARGATMLRRSLKRNPLQRLFGLPVTRPPRDLGSWTYSHGVVRIDLTRTPELRRPEGALRLSGGELPFPLLVLHGDDGRLHAFWNQCGHRGRCLDPLGGTCTLQCCSVGRSVFDYSGRVVRGPANRSLRVCPLSLRGTNAHVLVCGGREVDGVGFPPIAAGLTRTRARPSRDPRTGLWISPVAR